MLVATPRCEENCGRIGDPSASPVAILRQGDPRRCCALTWLGGAHSLDRAGTLAARPRPKSAVSLSITFLHRRFSWPSRLFRSSLAAIRLLRRCCFKRFCVDYFLTRVREARESWARAVGKSICRCFKANGMRRRQLRKSVARQRSSVGV